MEIIGSVEQVSITELRLKAIDAKVDTGAKSSSIHCESVKTTGGTVHFTILNPEDQNAAELHSLPVAMIETVRSSNGITERRIFVRLTITLGAVSAETLVSLADRSSMKYPMLLGRRFLSGRFLVDCSRTYLFGENE